MSTHVHEYSCTAIGAQNALIFIRNEMPDFSFVLPSYNGGAYFKECVRGIRAQTRPDWQLAVLDDCSSDDSLEWLASLNDARITAFPSKKRLGIERNWARALEIPLHPWMTIIAQDDLLDANYLDVMSELIEKNSDAGLLFAHFRFIDERGETQRVCRAMPERESAAQYITELFCDRRDTHAAGYMWPSQKYREVGGIPLYRGLLFADDALWIKLMQGSYKATAHAQCFGVRTHRDSASHAPDWRSWMAGMEEYLPFLESVAATDSDFARACERFAPHYFKRWCRNVYILAMMQATHRNRRVAVETFDEIASVLHRAAPQWEADFRASRSERGLRLREWINANPLARRLYQMRLNRRA